MSSLFFTLKVKKYWWRIAVFIIFLPLCVSQDEKLFKIFTVQLAWTWMHMSNWNAKQTCCKNSLTATVNNEYFPIYIYCDCGFDCSLWWCWCSVIPCDWSLHIPAAGLNLTLRLKTGKQLVKNCIGNHMFPENLLCFNNIQENTLYCCTEMQ